MKAAPHLLPSQRCIPCCMIILISSLRGHKIWDTPIWLNIGSTQVMSSQVRQRSQWFPSPLREEPQKAVSEVKQQGLIEQSWSSLVVLVKKKDGTLRFRVDYRWLNEVTHKDSYPLPRYYSGSYGWYEVFSTLDLRSSYRQVKLDEYTKEKTAFSTGNGLWNLKFRHSGSVMSQPPLSGWWSKCLWVCPDL